MRIMVGISLAAMLVASVAPAAAKDTPAVIVERDRAVPGGRAVQIAVPQTRIDTSFEVGRVASDSYGGGLIGAIIISSMDDKREVMGRSLQEKAETTVAPLREALRTFDVDGLALATTRAALAETAWFQARDIVATKESSRQSRAAFYQTSTAPQVAFVTYRYGLSPDFTHIRVTADIALMRKPVARGATAQPEPFYEQTISSIVQLRSRSYEHHENVAQWSADDGKLAKASLIAAFGQIERLIPYALSLDAAEAGQFADKNRPKAFGAGFYGALIRKDEAAEGTLLWSRGLVYVQSTPAR